MQATLTHIITRKPFFTSFLPPIKLSVEDAPDGGYSDGMRVDNFTEKKLILLIPPSYILDDIATRHILTYYYAEYKAHLLPIGMNILIQLFMHVNCSFNMALHCDRNTLVMTFSILMQLF